MTTATPTPPPSTDPMSGRLHELSDLIDREAWPEVASALDRAWEPCEVWLRTLARNLASMREHRSALYAVVRDAIPSLASFAIDVQPNAERSDARALEIFAATRLIRQAAQTVALAGIGDGRVLRAHARFVPPQLLLGKQQEIVVIEPDLCRLIAGLGYADLSGPRGAFEQRRITWYVGASWVDDLASDLITQPTKIAPMRAEPTVTHRPEIDSGLEEVQRRLQEVMEARKEASKRYYDSLSDEELVDVLGPHPRRQPRMLMLTSQFSSVLQYSTNDSAQAMRELGWDVQICTEKEMWHSASPHSVLAAIDSFKPDVLFQIDHLRYEFKDLIPSRLPFVCWIQDHLANLTNDFAGGSITDRDFVLTGATYRYVSRYGYPRRQCIDMAKSARPPVLPASWTCDREDIFYVSHWSQRAETVIASMCARTRELGGAATEHAMHVCCADMLAAYGHGESFPTPLKVRALVRRVFDRLKLDLTEQLDIFFVDALYQRLNQVFYRQQALTWAGQIADELGLKFGIYGRDWEEHPTLGRFARGVVQYGPELERLTRESKILLQLEPYACYSHQRMLDSLLAGGFTLVRSHPFNTVPIYVRQFLDSYAPPELNSVVEVMEALSPPLQEQFRTLLDEAQDIAAMGDVVDVVRGWQRSGLIGNADVALPYISEVSFDSYHTLRERIRHFVADDSARRQIASAQREAVLDRLTYYQTLKGAMRKIHRLLQESSQQRTDAACIREAA